MRGVDGEERVERVSDFLLELRSEEIPARMQARARDDLRWAFETEIRQEGALHQGSITTYATPRRIVLIARNLADATEFDVEEIKGPRVGAPDAAIEGFVRKLGVGRDQIFQKEDAKGATWFYQRHKPSRATKDVLATIIPRIIRSFPWPKSMRWGAASASTESLRWVRPLQGIVALFGDEVVPCAIAGITSGAATLGHRVHHPGVITIGGAHDYVEKLRACHVIVDQDERAAIIRAGATEAARAAGLVLVEDEGLVAENAGLTEWPVALLGRFDPAFLDVLPEVIQLTARVNQKYFVCRDSDGKLANAFVCTANIEASDGGAQIVEGNRKVLAARLSDARFFYDTDLKVPLEEQAKKLDRIVFHEKLGTVADKVERVARLARWLVEEGIVKGADPAHAARAARLAKADLVTGMVGEFPELQGLMGGYYAAAQGEPREVWEAVRDHYKPVGQGDDVPTAPVTVAVSLADKLDTLFQFFNEAMTPTGSRDPFALRRAAIAVIALVIENRLRLSLTDIFSRERIQWKYSLRIAQVGDIPTLEDAKEGYSIWSDPETWDAEGGDHVVKQGDRVIARFRYRLSPDEKEFQRRVHQPNRVSDLLDFFADRLKVQQREAGVRHDLIDAVFALGGEDDLVRLLARVCALQAFVGTEDGANLLAGYKRAANILKKEGWAVAADESGEAGPRLGGRGDGEGGSARQPEPAEAALVAALDAAEPAAAGAIAREDFEAAMTALATLRAPIDAFFEGVTVNDADPAKRAARLALLARVREAVHGVADFSRIEG